MSGAIKTYLLSVAAVAVLLSLVQSVLPKGNTRRIAGFTGGLLMILVVLSPVLKVEYEDLARSIARVQIEAEELETGVRTGNREILSELIKQRCETYILDKARSHGMSLQVEVELNDDEGYPYPEGVVLKGNFTERQRALLTADISENLGVPAERQEWIST